MNVLVDFSPERLATMAPTELSDCLEQGHIARFPVCPFPLPTEDELNFLRSALPELMVGKNVSYHPEVDRVFGVRSGAEAEKLRGILKAHNARVVNFLDRAIPGLMQDTVVGTSSFRPLQEKNRKLPAHASNELVHIDAGAYGATHGDRVLRFFINANPAGEKRVWTTKGSFRDLYERYGKAAGIAPGRKGRLDLGPGDRLRTGLVDLLAKLNPAAKTALDSSPYDRLMRRFHNYMKDTPEFQSNMETHEEMLFEPYSAWVCFTDAVSHAVIEGRHALVDTFVVPLKNCRLKEHAPYHILNAA